MSALLTIEEGGVCLGELEKLREFHEAGARMLTLTWNYENELGHPAAMQGDHWKNYRANEKRPLGLKERGFEFVAEMERLGMIVDVSHLSDDGFFDLCEHATKPFVASHSNSRAMCGHRRNLTDEMLRAVGEKGGVVGLNFYSAFLTEKKERAGLEMLAEHAKRMIRMAGEDAVALGTDFDGFERKDLPEKLEGAERIELVWDAFQKAGITSRQTEKIAYGNLFRVIEAGCGKTSVS